MNEGCREGITGRWLLDRRDGRLSKGREEALHRHLAPGCEPCRSEIRAIEETLAAIAAGPLPAPPRAASRRAKRLFLRARVGAIAEAARRVLARLVFDQRVSPAVALRSAPGTTRRLLWEAGGVEIYVTLTRTGRGWSLEGQVVPREDDGRDLEGAVILMAAEREMGRRELGPAGRFSFSGLRKGSISLEGVAEGTGFEVPAFVLE